MRRFDLILASIVVALTGCGGGSRPSASIPVKINVDNVSEWVSGDGGPIIVLQRAAVPLWEGASDYENSIMAGGNNRTDYDIICELGDGIHVLTHHDHDMIVMSDAEWATKFLRKDGEVFLFQSMAHERDPVLIVEECRTAKPDHVIDFRQTSDSLRLMVGADSGAERFYESHTCKLPPGKYSLRVFGRADCFVVWICKA